MERKNCSICEKEKQLSEYYTQKRKNKDGEEWIYYNPECKECTKKKAKGWQRENWDRKLEVNRNYQKTKKGKASHKKYSDTLGETGKRKDWEAKNRDKLKKYGLCRMNKDHKITPEEWESCKNHFNYRCAYCGLPIEEHFIILKGKKKLGDFHKEHVNHEGSNDLSNCVPACRSCNIHKWAFALEDWYNENNEIFTPDKLEKIHNWINGDYEQYIQERKIT